MNKQEKLYLIEIHEDELQHLESMELYELTKIKKLPKEILLYLGGKSIKDIKKIIKDE